MAAPTQSPIISSRPEAEHFTDPGGFDRHVLLLQVEALVCRRLSVSLEHVHGCARGVQRVVSARHLILYLTRAVGRLSINRTAALVGRDRRMVAYAINRIEAQREDDPAWDRLVDLIAAEAAHVVAQRIGGPAHLGRFH